MESRTRVIKIPFLALTVPIRAEDHFPKKIPKRWILVSDFVRKSCSFDSDVDDTLHMTLGSGNDPVFFDGSPVHCKMTFSVLTSTHPEVVDSHSSY